MKTRQLIVPAAFVCLTLGAFTASAAQSSASSKPATTTAAKPMATTTAKTSSKSHTMSGEFVSADSTAKTITVKDSKGAESTLMLKDKAVTEVATLKPGDKLWLTSWPAPTGASMMSVTAIRVEHATKK